MSAISKKKTEERQRTRRQKKRAYLRQYPDRAENRFLYAMEKPELDEDPMGSDPENGPRTW